MLFHDATLDRVMGESGNLEDFTYDELCHKRVVHAPSGREDIVPKLEDFLHYYGSSGVHLALELKSPDIESEVFLMVKKYYLEKQVTVTSFSLDYLTALKKDYPDPYTCHYAEHDEFAKKWGMCEPFISETQDVKYNKYGLMKWEDDGDYTVREAYWCLGLISKYCKRNAKVLDIENDDPLVRMTALINRDGTITIAAVNRHTEPTPIKLSLNLKNIKKQKPLRVYEYDSRNVCTNEFGDLQDFTTLLPIGEGEVEYTLLPESFTVLTSDYKEREKTLFAQKVVLKNNLLSWNPVSDPEHCYYRVYRGTKPDFTPSRENQIASTVDTSLDLNARYLDDSAILNVKGRYYKVVSVDRSGNGIIL